MDASLQEVSLASLGGGAAIELFDDELAKVLANVADPNAPAEQVREVSLKLKIKPSAKRDFATITLECSSKRAASKPFATQLLLGTDGETVHAYESHAKQPELDLDKVSAFRKKEREA